MRQRIEWTLNTLPKSDDTRLPIMAPENVEAARTFHQSFPQYDPTPLVALDAMAKRLGLAGVCVKDESFRFGLNAFKALGVSFAMGSYIAKQTGRAIAECDYNYLTGNQLVRDFGQATFVTATDGNHGRGVAWTARQLGQKAVVHMPLGATQARFDNIAEEGAQVTVEQLNYDDCVRLAAREAESIERAVLLQDTAWDGYEEIPTWIMQGYGTLSSEAVEQLANLGIGKPTHVFVQAGVGSLASSVVGYLANVFGGDAPRTVIVEAAAANCLFQSALAGDGQPRAVTGDLKTIMAGLSCGEPSTLGWDILRNHATVFLSCPDWVAENGMRLLARPLDGDQRVVSGESGAVGMGALAAIMLDPTYAELKTALELDGNSSVLLISTEGDTDPEQYRRIVETGS